MTKVIAIQHLYTSPAHNYFGHHGQPAGTHQMVEREEVICVAGRGIEGDRFFDFKNNYKGQITLFAEEVHLGLCEQFDVADRPASVFRRNVITHGVDLNDWIARRFSLGELMLEGVEECRPCAWMDEAFHPGAMAAMAGRGGLRARILNDGILRTGEVVWREV